MPFLAPEAEQGNLLIDDSSQEKNAKQLDVAVVTAAFLLQTL